MCARYVRTIADLPDHDLILDLGRGLICHIRHYVHDDTHVIVAGQLKGGVSPIGNARAIAAEASEVVIPPGREFTLVAYVPQWPLSSDSHFHEVTFEVGGYERRLSAALFEDTRVALACFRALDLSAVELMTGRPILTYRRLGVRVCARCGLRTRTLMELVGLEPTTSCMPCKRSPS
jgi:hypothetical protein